MVNRSVSEMQTARYTRRMNSLLPAEESPTRTRLLDAAAELFYNDGVSAGVEHLCRVAGVSKRSMYQLFDSKDELIAASLARSIPGYLSQLISDTDESLEPRTRIMLVFERLEHVIVDPSFRGCPYVSAAMELKSESHPARLVARQFHTTLTNYFYQAAADGGARNPLLVAQQLTMIHDGATARAVVQDLPSPGLSVATAGTLLDCAGLTA